MARALTATTVDASQFTPAPRRLTDIEHHERPVLTTAEYERERAAGLVRIGHPLRRDLDGQMVPA